MFVFVYLAYFIAIHKYLYVYDVDELRFLGGGVVNIFPLIIFLFPCNISLTMIQLLSLLHHVFLIVTKSGLASSISYDLLTLFFFLHLFILLLLLLLLLLYPTPPPLPPPPLLPLPPPFPPTPPPPPLHSSPGATAAAAAAAATDAVSYSATTTTSSTSSSSPSCPPSVPITCPCRRIITVCTVRIHDGRGWSGRSVRNYT